DTFFVIYDVQDGGNVDAVTIEKGANGSGTFAGSKNGQLALTKAEAEELKEWGTNYEVKEEVGIQRPRTCKIVEIKAESGKPEVAARLIRKFFKQGPVNGVGTSLKAGAIPIGSITNKCWVAKSSNVEEKEWL